VDHPASITAAAPHIAPRHPRATLGAPPLLCVVLHFMRLPALQVLWSSTFAFSTNLLLLVVYEVVDIIEPGCAQAP
jgi:hypothetical protein